MDPKQRMIRRDFDLVFDGVGLKAYTKTIDGKEVKFLGGSASSNAKDLYGDVISPAGQVEMLTKLRHLADEMKDQNSGLTGWLNHSYKIPEDTLGAFVDASLATRTGDGVDGEKGVEYIDLDIECRVTDTNPRAVAAWEQVKDGIRHGWSIGAIFTDCEWASNDPDSPDYWSLLVNGVNLLEISLVGIPANQRAWCKNQDDLKSVAVKRAEEIVREAHATKSADRSVARDSVKLRDMVLKSLVHEPADTTTTSPITARAAEPGAQLGLLVPEVKTGEEPAVTSESTEEVEVQNGGEPAEVKTAETVTEEPKVEATGETQAAATLSVERPDGNIPGLLAANELLCKTFGVTLAAVLDGEKWVGTEIRSAKLEGDVIQVGEVVKSADEIDVKGIAKVLLGLDDAQLSDLSTQLRALDGDESLKALAAQAADAIDVLTKAATVIETRDSDDGDLSPDDNRDRIALAIGHIAKAVGHGICARAASHLAKACAELSAAVGSEVEPPAPDETLSAQVEKLQPKAGDVIVFKTDEPDRLHTIKSAIGDGLTDLGVKVLFFTNAAAASIDNDLAAKAQELTTTTDALTAKQTELQTVESSITEKQTALSDLEQKTADAQARLTALEAKIAEDEKKRVGRKSAAFDMKSFIEAKSDTEVKPEHYQQNSVQTREAIARQSSGDGKPPTGWDVANGH